MGCGQAATASPGSWLTCIFLDPILRNTESKCLGLGLGNLCLNTSDGWLVCTLACVWAQWVPILVCAEVSCGVLKTLMPEALVITLEWSWAPGLFKLLNWFYFAAKVEDHCLGDSHQKLLRFCPDWRNRNVFFWKNKVILARAWEWRLHRPDNPLCPHRNPSAREENAKRLCGLGALALSRVPRSQHISFPSTSQFFPQPRPCWEMKPPSHLATWRMITSQCLERPMAKVTDPQIAHLVRHRGLDLVPCLVV